MRNTISIAIEIKKFVEHFSYGPGVGFGTRLGKNFSGYATQQRRVVTTNNRIEMGLVKTNFLSQVMSNSVFDLRKLRHESTYCQICFVRCDFVELNHGGSPVRCRTRVQKENP